MNTSMHSIETAIARLYHEGADTRENIIEVLEAIRRAMNEDADFIVPVEFLEGAFCGDPLSLKPGDTITSSEFLRCRIHSITLQTGEVTLPAFTSYAQLEQGTAVSSIVMGIGQLLHMALVSEEFIGILINAWDQSFLLSKSFVRMIFRAQVLQSLEEAGPSAAELAKERSMDLELNWYIRKLYAIEALILADQEEKKQALLNVRNTLSSLLEALNRDGTDLWKHMDAPAFLQAWYYSKVQDNLEELQDNPETAGTYWEMMNLYKDLFVSYYLDGEDNILYQISLDGEGYVLDKKTLQWEPLCEEIPEGVRKMTREEAEGLEDNWREKFWMQHEKDLENQEFDIFSSEIRSLTLSIYNRMIVFSGEDFGPMEREFHYAVDEENTSRFQMELRMKYGTEDRLLDALKSEFGYDDGLYRFQQFCDERKIKYQVMCI